MSVEIAPETLECSLYPGSSFPPHLTLSAALDARLHFAVARERLRPIRECGWQRFADDVKTLSF
jgi:hypothetical protein